MLHRCWSRGESNTSDGSAVRWFCQLSFPSRRSRASGKGFKIDSRTHEICGTSVRNGSRISRAGDRHLRRALYVPALVGSRCDPHIKGFYESLPSCGGVAIGIQLAAPGPGIADRNADYRSDDLHRGQSSLSRAPDMLCRATGMLYPGRRGPRNILRS